MSPMMTSNQPRVKIWVQRGSGALRPSPEAVASSPRTTPCSAPRPWRCAQSLPATSGTAAGWQRGRGPCEIFRNPMVAVSARKPAIRLHPMRDPVNRPLAESQREPAGRLDLRDFARSRIRCSWRLGPVRFRQASSPEDNGDEREGSPKKFRWPLTASAPSAQPDAPRRMSNPKRGSARPASGMPPDDGSPSTALRSPRCA